VEDEAAAEGGAAGVQSSLLLTIFKKLRSSQRPPQLNFVKVGKMHAMQESVLV
jgi:hypothetical protein